MEKPNENNSSESSSDTNDEDTNDYMNHVDATQVRIREKRQIVWSCDVDEEHGIAETSAPPVHSIRRPIRITWPPPPNSSINVNTDSWRSGLLRPVKLGNPLYGTKMQLYSLTQHHLAVYPDGTVRGTKDENDLHTYLELTSVEHPGHVRIKGLLTNLYVAMDNKGRLYGEPDVTEEGTVFIEFFQGSYNAYLSRKFAHLGWYIGIKKSGKIKRGPKTAYGQKAVRFLPRRSKFE